MPARSVIIASVLTATVATGVAVMPFNHGLGIGGPPTLVQVPGNTQGGNAQGDTSQDANSQGNSKGGNPQNPKAKGGNPHGGTVTTPSPTPPPLQTSTLQPVPSGTPGTYRLIIAGSMRGEGTAIVSGYTVQFTATVTDPTGKSMDLVLQPVAMTQNSFAGTVNVNGQSATLSGRLDPPDTVDGKLQPPHMTCTIVALPDGPFLRAAGYMVNP